MKLLPYIVVIFWFVSANAQQTASNNAFELTGTIRGQESGNVTIVYPGITGKMVRDTSVLTAGKFSFKGQIPHPVPVTLRGTVGSIADDDPNCAQFYIEPEAMQLLLEKDHFKSFVLAGSYTQRQNDSLIESVRGLNPNVPNFRDSVVHTISRFIKTHPTSYVSAFELCVIMSGLAIDSVINLYNRMDIPVRESYYGREVYETLLTITNAATGKRALQFSGMDRDGRKISLSDFRGQYVLLDFWASWCIPCRKEFPALVELYRTYHAKGLVIIGISSDDDEDNWLTAIRDDGINIWNHILDYKGGDRNDDRRNFISRQYGVLSLPTKILIGPDGKIIQRFSFSQNVPTLEDTLRVIFKDN